MKATLHAEFGRCTPIHSSTYNAESSSLKGVQSSTCNICPGYTGPNVSTLLNSY